MAERCNICDKETAELCPDGVCRCCHKSVSWEDCCDGTWNAKQMRRAGHTVEEIQELYPNARIKGVSNG